MDGAFFGDQSQDRRGCPVDCLAARLRIGRDGAIRKRSNEATYKGWGRWAKKCAGEPRKLDAAMPHGAARAQLHCGPKTPNVDNQRRKAAKGA